MSKRTAVMRHMIADYLNVGTAEKAEYALMEPDLLPWTKAQEHRRNL